MTKRWLLAVMFTCMSVFGLVTTASAACCYGGDGGSVCCGCKCWASADGCDIEPCGSNPWPPV